MAIAGALFAVNASAKVGGLVWYTGQPAPGGGRQVDFVYYLRELLPGAGEVDLALPATALLLLGVVAGAWQCCQRRELRPVVVMVAVFYVMYSVATVKHPRYVATMIPLLAVLAGAAMERWSR